MVAMNDTLMRKLGRKVHGTGWKRDPWDRRSEEFCMEAALPSSLGGIPGSILKVLAIAKIPFIISSSLVMEGEYEDINSRKEWY